MNIEAIAKAVKIVGGQAALARACGISQPAVHKWLSGKCQPNLRFAPAIEKATGGKVNRIDLCPEFFLCDSKPAPPPQPRPEAPRPPAGGA